MRLNYYNNISKLPLSRFIQCLCENDLQALVIEGEVDDRTLSDAWAEIQSQYADSIADLEYKLYISLFKEVYQLTIKIQMIELLVSTLRNFYVEQFAKELNKLLGTKCKFDFEDKESYTADLDKCHSRGKGFGIQLDLKSIAFKKLEEKISKNKKASQEYFQSLLNVLEEQFHTNIDEETTTVFRFTDRLKRLERQMKMNIRHRFY